MTKAIAVYPDNRVEDVEVNGYKDGQAIVGGRIEPVALRFGSNDYGTMYVNEEFRYVFDADDFNEIARSVAGLCGRLDLLIGGVLGPVYFVGDLDEEGYVNDVTERIRQVVERVAREARPK